MRVGDEVKVTNPGTSFFGMTGRVVQITDSDRLSVWVDLEEWAGVPFKSFEPERLSASTTPEEL